MNLYVKFTSKVDVHLSFILVTIIIIALGYIEQFFMLLFAVLLHELGHIAAARIFNKKTSKLIFTPLGLTAVVEGLDHTPQVTRAFIFISGPFISLILSMISYTFNFSVGLYINLAILLLNLLPVYPLDGGKLIQLLLDNMIGAMTTIRFMRTMGKVFSILIILAGVVQVILFPYNISLICMGVYLMKLHDKEYMRAHITFYTTLLQHVEGKNKRCLQVKTFTVSPDYPIKNILYHFYRDYYNMVQVIDGKKLVCTITEAEVAEFILNHGLFSVVSDIYQQKHKIVD